ncbi:hypothetical protein WCD74_22320 [Actinomycetospora sp. OC33-EN08]|uniref:Acyl-ACP thioesterase n=1 Tax=Actinomycetospora aurantiaca TaxID=3129233 RepID=A0ABU8MT72_9PSEU
MTGCQSADVATAASAFPDVRHLGLRHSDLGPRGAMSTSALARLFEHPRVMLPLPRFERLAASGQFGRFRILLVGQRVERHVDSGGPDAQVQIGTGIRRIGTSSFTYGQALFSEGVLVASAQASIVLADRDGPKPLPDALQTDLRELLLTDEETPSPSVTRDEASLRPEHYGAWTSVTTRITDVDANRHVNYIATLGLYDDAVVSAVHGLVGTEDIARISALLPWRYDVSYLGEVLYPGDYRVGVAVTGHDDENVHYDLGLFGDGRCLGIAAASAARSGLPLESLPRRVSGSTRG